MYKFWTTSSVRKTPSHSKPSNAPPHKFATLEGAVAQAERLMEEDLGIVEVHVMECIKRVFRQSPPITTEGVTETAPPAPFPGPQTSDDDD